MVYYDAVSYENLWECFVGFKRSFVGICGRNNAHPWEFDENKVATLMPFITENVNLSGV